jgi:hypothetical protein
VVKPWSTAAAIRRRRGTGEDGDEGEARADSSRRDDRCGCVEPLIHGLEADGGDGWCG